MVGLPAVLALSALACGELPSPTRPGPPQPFIRLLLRTDSTDHVATVQYTTPAESLVVVVPRPVAPESVSLAVRTPDGTDIPLIALPGDSGLYRFTLPVVHGATYRLVGSVLGRPVEAHTTVPGPLVVREPAGDTLRMSIAALNERRQVLVPYAWAAAGATAYQIRTTGTEDRRTEGRGFRDTSGVLIADVDLLVGRNPQTTLLRILALDTTEGNFRGNIAGTLGRFGSASVLDPPKVILWQ
jgi:hypothetical protein